MEEEKKEECCEAKKFHHCCGHKAGRVIILILAVVLIFSLGVLFGSCKKYNHEGRGGQQFNFEQRDGRGMMNNRTEGGGCRFQNEDVNVGGCPMKNGGNAVQAESGCKMQNIQQTQVQSIPAVQIKTVTPVK